MPRDPNPFPAAINVRVCRAAACAARADSGAVPGFCLEHAADVLALRRWLGGHSEFFHAGFDADRAAWQREPR